MAIESPRSQASATEFCGVEDFRASASEEFRIRSTVTFVQYLFRSSRILFYNMDYISARIFRTVEVNFK